MNERAWIFVSHSSEDIVRVRSVRNHLEELAASPLLFHLLALTEPEEFWPLIEREILARNFFLYCKSAAAEESEWVRRELEVVQKKPVKRFETIQVDQGPIDFSSLAEFVAMTRVFPSFSHRDRDKVAPFLQALRLAGFSIFDDLTEIQPAVSWQEQIKRELDNAATRGWIVAFLSSFSVQRPNIMAEIEYALHLGARFVPVVLEPVALPPRLAALQTFNGFSNASAPYDLANMLLTRQRS